MLLPLSAIAVLGDVDADGVDDFVVSDPCWTLDGHRGWLVAVSGRTRGVLWEVRGEESSGCGTDLDPLGDLDGDGVLDLAEQGNRPCLRLRSGVSGAVLLRVPGYRATPVGDLDDDGVGDLRVWGPGPATAREPAPARWVSGASGKELEVQLPTTDRPITGRPVALGDLDDDRGVEWGIEATDGLRVLDESRALRLAAGTELRALGLPSSPGAGPVAAVVGNDGGRVWVTDRPIRHADSIGTRLLLYRDLDASEGRAPAPQRVQLRGPIPDGIFLENLGDVSGDGVEDFLLGADGCLVFPRTMPAVRSGSDGTPLWSYETREVICRTQLVAAGDLDGDGARDVLATGSWATGGPVIEGWVEALSGRTGERIFRLQRDDLID